MILFSSWIRRTAVTATPTGYASRTITKVWSMTTLYCIGGTEQSACNSMHFACRDPEKCQVVCQKEYDHKEEHYVCNSIHVCPGTKVICQDKDGNKLDCDGITNGIDDEADDCWPEYCNDEALHF